MTCRQVAKQLNIGWHQASIGSPLPRQAEGVSEAIDSNGKSLKDNEIM